MNNEIDVNEQQIEDAIDVSLVAILGYLVAISGSLGRARITHFSDRYLSYHVPAQARCPSQSNLKMDRSIWVSQRSFM